MVFKSKQKGNSGELEISKILSILTGYKWHRVPCSGAIATCGGDETLQSDVYCKDGGYEDLIIEVKNHKGGVSINDLLNEKSKYSSWLNQVKSEAKYPSPLSGDSKEVRYLNKNWLLFFKSHRKWFWTKPQGGVWQYPDLLTALRKHSKFYYNLGMLTTTLKQLQLKEEKLKSDKLKLEKEKLKRETCKGEQE